MLLRCLTLVFAFTLLACGGSSDSNEAAPSDGAAPDTAAEQASNEAPPAATTEGSSSEDPCDLLTVEEVAAALGADASEVAAGTPGPYSDPGSPECVWEAVHNGLEDTVTLWMRSRDENTAPNGWSNAIRNMIDNGETIGSQTLSHEPVDLGGVSGGALSNVHGSAFVKSRIYSWQVDEETYYRLTIGRSFEDSGGELPDPSAETFGSLVTAIMQ